MKATSGATRPSDSNRGPGSQRSFPAPVTVFAVAAMTACDNPCASSIAASRSFIPAKAPHRTSAMYRSRSAAALLVTSGCGSSLAAKASASSMRWQKPWIVEIGARS